MARGSSMIKYNNYFASELEKHAIAITQYQHPCTIQLGDVNNIDVYSDKYRDVDLLLAGSPCTSFSVAGKRDGFKAESGQLFYRFVDALKAIKPKYFLLENVKMSFYFSSFAYLHHSSLLTFNTIPPYCTIISCR